VDKNEGVKMDLKSADYIISVDMACDVKTLLAKNVDVKCVNDSVKSTIDRSKNDDLLLIKKVIKSPTLIVYANVVGDDFINNIL